MQPSPSPRRSPRSESRRRAPRWICCRFYAGGSRELERYSAGAVLQTDDRTALEYSAPRGIYGRTSSDNAAAIRRLGGELPADVRGVVDRASDGDWTSRGRMELRADAHTLAFEAFRRAVVLNSRNADALAGMSEAAAGARREIEARGIVQGIVDREPTVNVGQFSLQVGNPRDAADYVAEGLTIEPNLRRLAPASRRRAPRSTRIHADVFPSKDP